MVCMEGVLAPHVKSQQADRESTSTLSNPLFPLTCTALPVHGWPRAENLRCLEGAVMAGQGMMEEWFQRAQVHLSLWLHVWDPVVP